MRTLNNKIKILSEGKFFKNDIIIKEVESKLNRNEEINQIIAKGWEIKKRIAQEKDFQFYDGPLVRFEDLELNEKITFLISCSITYKDVVGIRAQFFEHLYSKFGTHFMPNALSVMNIIVTKDGKIPIIWRHSGDWGESYEISGGFVKRAERHDIFQASLNRIKDDFFLPSSIVKEHILIAVYEYPSISETTACFLVKLEISSKEVLKYANNKNIKFLDVSEDLIRQLPEKIHKPSLTALNYYKKMAWS